MLPDLDPVMVINCGNYRQRPEEQDRVTGSLFVVVVLRLISWPQFAFMTTPRHAPLGCLKDVARPENSCALDVHWERRIARLRAMASPPSEERSSNLPLKISIDSSMYWTD